MNTVTNWKINHYPAALVALAMLASILLLVVIPKDARAAFPGKNGKIVFASNRTTGSGVDNPTGDFEIFTMNADGTGLKQLTRNTAGDDRPTYSPDGKKISFDSDRTGNREIFVMNTDGTGQTNLTKNAQTDLDPAFSPDGKKIAFTSGRSGNGLDVFVMHADGSGPTNLTNNPASDSAPTFSPDGTRIAFQTSRAGDSDIFLMGADGSNPTDLTFGTAFDFAPSFSPDGTKVAFSSNRDGDFDIFVITTDGSSRTPLTRDTATDQEPAFSPDGDKIAYRSDRTGNDEVFVMSSDGSNQADLTNNAALDLEVDWQPLHSTFTVNSTGDGVDLTPGDDVCKGVGGQCTLRAAIQEANATPGHDTIRFNIAGTGVHTISVGSSGEGSLPPITDPVTIDGYTQPGASPNSATSGTNAVLKIALSGTNAPGGSDGLVLGDGAGGTTIRGLVIGGFEETNFSGGQAVKLLDVPNNSGNVISGNFVGTNAAGTAIDTNGTGVVVNSEGNTIGGLALADRNLLSGNFRGGVGLNSDNNKVLNNLIGTDRTGTKDLGNKIAGVGVSISNDNIIGGARPNTIAFNGADGIIIGGGQIDGNRVLGNSIFFNGDLGIDLAGEGITSNDPGDGDVGSNRLQNFPVLTSAKTVSGKTTIAGSLDSARSETFVIQFFSNPPDTNEGKTFIGQKKITTSAEGPTSFAFSPKSDVALNRAITATATRSSTGDTSEFSALRRVTAS